MSRPLRIEFPGAWYHVMNRGSGRKPIFLSNEDRRIFLDLLGETSQVFHIEVHAYSLLDNHYHLLLQTPKGSLGRGMRHLNGVYTQRFNRAHKTDGPLFRGRYKALLVETDEYLLELVRYIHLNPVKAGLCAHPKDHPWTSHVAYLQRHTRPKWLMTEEVLLHFGSKERRATQRMDEFVGEGVPKKFEEAMKRNRVILGTQGFQEWVYQNILDQKKHDKEIALKDRIRSPQVTPRKILEHISHAYDVRINQIRRSERGKENESRGMAAYLIRQLTGLPQKEIALWIGCPTAYTVATIQRRFKTRLLRDKKMRKLANELTHTILTHVKT